MRNADGAVGRKPSRRVLFIGGYAVLGLIGILMSNARPRVERASTASSPSTQIAPAHGQPEPAPTPTAPARRESAATAPLSAAQVRSVVEDPVAMARLDDLHGLVGKHAWRPARKLVDEMAPVLAAISEIPTNATIEPDRLVLARGAELKTRFEQDRLALTRFELQVFDTAFRQLWAPENAKKAEDKMLAAVARQFHLRIDDVKTILILHDDLMTARLAQRDIAERAELEARCGPEPLRSEWDGSMPAVERHVRRTAHDPSSVEVRNCAAPTLAGKACWSTVCDVRGTNALGVQVLTTLRFTIAKGAGPGSELVTMASQP